MRWSFNVFQTSLWASFCAGIPFNSNNLKANTMMRIFVNNREIQQCLHFIAVSLIMLSITGCSTSKQPHYNMPANASGTETSILKQTIVTKAKILGKWSGWEGVPVVSIDGQENVFQKSYMVVPTSAGCTIPAGKHEVVIQYRYIMGSQYEWGKQRKVIFEAKPGHTYFTQWYGWTEKKGNWITRSSQSYAQVWIEDQETGEKHMPLEE